MILNVAATGSQGNCYLLIDGKHTLMLDCGESVHWREIVKASGYRTSAIDAALISHKHGDHLGHIRDLHLSGIKVYSNDETKKAVEESTGERIGGLPEKKKTMLKGGWSVVPWYVPHEQIPNFAYYIESPSNERLVYITDFEYSPLTVRSFRVNHFLIAVSRTESVPEDAGGREHRIRGHSTLDVVQGFLEASVSEATRSITACHLSGVYADPEKVRQVLTDRFPNIAVNIARKGVSIKL